MKYIIEGIPQQQERPRAAYINKKIVLYDPPNSKKYKEFLKKEIQKQEVKLLTEPIKVKIHFFVPIPKSYTKKQHALIQENKLLPSKKPDLSNYIKLIEDAFNNILYKDDAQIIELIAKKSYSETPRIEIEVNKLVEE